MRRVPARNRVAAQAYQLRRRNAPGTATVRSSRCLGSRGLSNSSSTQLGQHRTALALPQHRYHASGTVSKYSGLGYLTPSGCQPSS
jgi:hypothetical protein